MLEKRYSFAFIVSSNNFYSYLREYIETVYCGEIKIADATIYLISIILGYLLLPQAIGLVINFIKKNKNEKKISQ
jgi:hypothetical protein